ncbi:FAD-dependent thymidylate synthase [Candidatus Fokinia crypta]|uniref:Flavin-dependent thymidylate synthase n=1 Tax=Candidatus Fokinia crypta TaxID=1920990 RepID=A0ABZ0UPW4_9RICK|nr:FAD-dependent thymidylate synthase [Candidatus Fokinia cryptica]WPX98168.1 Thymidylate synthase ThyX [Candidatus Fokinia cryptica]
MERCVSTELDKVLGKSFDVLDKGFIRVIDYMGDDSSVVQAARVSYGKGTKKMLEDRALIRYLMRNRHTTPFEMCEIKFHVKLPIFIARQWMRHRTGSFNEYSARYSILDSDMYTPEDSVPCLQSSHNKQGRDITDTSTLGVQMKDSAKENSERAYKLYEELLEKGVAREIARIVLPLNCYTQFYWKVNLNNLMHFIKLRIDKHAQYEIRQYAERLHHILQIWVPTSFEAFNDYLLNGVYLSEKVMVILKRKINGEDLKYEDSGLSKQEWSTIESLFIRAE